MGQCSTVCLESGMTSPFPLQFHRNIELRGCLAEMSELFFRYKTPSGELCSAGQENLSEFVWSCTVVANKLAFNIYLLPHG